MPTRMSEQAVASMVRDEVLKLVTTSQRGYGASSIRLFSELLSDIEPRKLWELMEGLNADDSKAFPSMAAEYRAWLEDEGIEIVAETIPPATLDPHSFVIDAFTRSVLIPQLAKVLA